MRIKYYHWTNFLRKSYYKEGPTQSTVRLSPFLFGHNDLDDLGSSD